MGVRNEGESMAWRLEGLTRPRPDQATVEAGLLLLVAAGAWAGTVILIAVGVMNVAAMVGLAVVVLIEKTWRWGPAAGRVAGVAALGLAVAVIWLPWLAPGLHAAPPMMMG